MAKIERALALVTGTSMDKAVVSIACDLVRPCKGQVWALYVIEVGRKLPLDAELPNETARGEHLLQRMEAFGKSLRCKVEGDILQARDTGAAIVREAADRQTDVIVAGMPYTEHYGSPSLGDMVPYVLRHSHCRVVVYREQQPEPVPEGAS